jgi:TPR repeat protein
MADPDRLALYTRVCEAKGGEVCADLASLHLNGIGTATDPARAKVLYDRACRTGDASACGLFERLSKSKAP